MKKCSQCNRTEEEENLIEVYNFFGNKEKTIFCEHCEYYYYKDFVPKRQKTEREMKEIYDRFGEGIMLFGKYKGMKFNEIPNEYYSWLKLQKWVRDDILEFIHIKLFFNKKYEL